MSRVPRPLLRTVPPVALAACLLLAGCGGAPHSATSPSPTHVRVTARPTAPAPPVTAGASAGVSKVLVVIEENHSLRQMRSGMPYLYGLAQRFGYATDYQAITHPSLPNYLAIAGGSTFGVSDDAGPSAHPISGQSVFGQAQAAGLSARLYAESMPRNCDTRAASPYAVKHAPWAYFVDERAGCQAGMVPAGVPGSGRLATDIAAGNLPTVGMLIPNLDHDAHDGSLAQADAWLRGWLGPILNGPDFTHGRLAVVVTADENDGSSGNTVLTVVLAPGVSHQVVTTPLDHYSLTRFLDGVAGTPPLRAAITATSLSAAFGVHLARS